MFKEAMKSCSNAIDQLTAVMKTTFFLVLVEAATFPPYLDADLFVSLWLMRHRTPIVFLSGETQTTHPNVWHSGHFIESPTSTIS
jgi:hypothetical protein